MRFLPILAAGLLVLLAAAPANANPPTPVACADPVHSVAQIVVDCTLYLLTLPPQLERWALADVPVWADQYVAAQEQHLLTYPQDVAAFLQKAHDDYVTYLNGGTDAALAWAQAVESTLTGYTQQEAVRLLVYVTDYAGYAVTYAAGYVDTLFGYAAGTASQALGDGEAIGDWALCHLIGVGCVVAPPVPHVPGAPPLPPIVDPAPPPTPSTPPPPPPFPVPGQPPEEDPPLPQVDQPNPPPPPL